MNEPAPPTGFKTATLAALRSVDNALFSFRWEFDRGNITTGSYLECTQPLLAQRLTLLTLLRDTEQSPAPDASEGGKGET